VSTWGCASLFQSGSSSSTEAPDYTGPFTLTNESQYSVCNIELYVQEEHFVRDLTADPLAPGESLTLEPGQMPYGIRLMECGNSHVLWDTYEVQNPYESDTIQPTTGAIVLSESGTQSLTSPIRLVVERTPVSAYLKPAGSLHSQYAAEALRVTQQLAQADTWLETVNSLTVVSNEWNIQRNEYTSIITGRQMMASVSQRWPDGHCTYQAMAYYQGYDGSSYSNTLRHNGFGLQDQVPCAALDLMDGGSAGSAAGAPAAPAAAPQGGNCTNTCRTANDNECDDGGPNSLYSVCALGTDCNDCGPR
jgi:hypothetical protein